MAAKKKTGLTKAETNKIKSGIKKSLKKPARAKIWNKEIMAWLFDGVVSTDIPFHWNYQKDQVKKVCNFQIIQKISAPRMVVFLNKWVNDLYNDPGIKDLLLFLKSYFQVNGCGPEVVDTSWTKPPDITRDKYISKVRETESIFDLGEGDLLERYRMLETGMFGEIDVSKEGEETDANREDFNSKANELLVRQQQQKMDLDPRYLKTLDAETIEKWGLALIDIKVIETLNKVLLVFIDIYNKKKFFLDDFQYEFFISLNSSPIYNDYLAPLDPKVHQAIVCRDIRTVDRLKQDLNKAQQKIIFKTLNP